MLELKAAFPSARFIHIIRDPRDYCLSNRKTWGKSILRAAEAWRESVTSACAAGRELGADYIEVHYEALLDEPEATLRPVCSFLGCPFDPAMLQLSAPSENLGDTKNVARIVTDNKRKYRAELSEREIRRVEEIVLPAARDVGYPTDSADVSFKALGRLERSLYAMHDAWATLRFRVGAHGLGRGLRFLYERHVRGRRS